MKKIILRFKIIIKFKYSVFISLSKYQLPESVKSVYLTITKSGNYLYLYLNNNS